RRGDREQALRVFSALHPDAPRDRLDAEIDTILQASKADRTSTEARGRRLVRPLLLAFLIAAFNQLSGINVILYFAPRILELAGLGTHAALLQSVGIGLINLIFTMLGLFLIDVMGR